MSRLVDEPEYNVWRGMLQRCRDKGCKSFIHYGGRGIRVEWDSYSDFLRDLGKRPSQSHTIERLDNDGNYSASNCVWALREVQGRNTRRVTLIDFRGEMLSMPQIAARIGMKYRTLSARVRERGWSFEKAITTGVKQCQ